MLFVGCHHAREWISVEMPYLLAEYLIENFDDNPSDDKGRRIKHLLVNREIWIVPGHRGHVGSVPVLRHLVEIVGFLAQHDDCQEYLGGRIRRSQGGEGGVFGRRLVARRLRLNG